jgi:hypothetical protein
MVFSSNSHLRQMSRVHQWKSLRRIEIPWPAEKIRISSFGSCRLLWVVKIHIRYRMKENEEFRIMKLSSTSDSSHGSKKKVFQLTKSIESSQTIDFYSSSLKRCNPYANYTCIDTKIEELKSFSHSFSVREFCSLWSIADFWTIPLDTECC